MALSSLAVGRPQRRFQELLRIADAVAVDGPSPAQVIGEVCGGHPIKMAQPVFETAVISVDVLDMNGAAHPFSLSQVDALMGNTRFARKALISAIGVGDQQHVATQFGQQVAVQGGHFQGPAPG